MLLEEDSGVDSKTHQDWWRKMQKSQSLLPWWQIYSEVWPECSSVLAFACPMSGWPSYNEFSNSCKKIHRLLEYPCYHFGLSCKCRGQPLLLESEKKQEEKVWWFSFFWALPMSLMTVFQSVSLGWTILNAGRRRWLWRTNSVMQSETVSIPPQGLSLRKEGFAIGSSVNERRVTW